MTTYIYQDVLERSSHTQEHQKTLLEKEVRKLRKEAHKVESVLIQAREELKSSKNSLRIAQSGLESEKAKSFKREQEAFTAEYKLVGLQEEMMKLQERMKVLEEEKDALKTSLKEEEVARIAAEGRIALPIALDDEEDDFMVPVSPKKSPRKKIADSEDKENIMPKRSIEIKVLQEELDQQRRLRHKAEDQVEFMKMECQFLCCSCRVAEQQGASYVHDNRFSDDIESMKQSVLILDEPALVVEEMDTTTTGDQGSTESARSTTPLEQPPSEQTEPNMAYSPTSGTFRSIPASGDEGKDADEATAEETMVDAPEVQAPVEEEMDSTVVHNPDAEADETTIPQDAQIDKTASAPEAASPVKEEESETEELPPQTPHVPHTPRFREVRTVTTTTTIPIAFTPSPSKAFENRPPIQTPATISHPPVFKVPMSPFTNPGSPTAALRPDGTLDREAALEQIRLRRGRARSVAMGLATPKKQMMEGVARRDISAPALKGRC